MAKFECPKCMGKGRINAFAHIESGVCFKCQGKGFVEQKSAPKKQKQFKVSFLWTDKDDCNYRNGDFCHCWTKGYQSENKANQAAAKAMKNNGSVEYKVEKVD